MSSAVISTSAESIRTVEAEDGYHLQFRVWPAKGLPAATLVLVTGEFGRTSVNGAAGRDHWPFVYSFLLTGAGIPGGRVIGASDARAQYPSSRPVTPADTYMEVCRLMGLDVSQKLRVARIVGDSPGIPELFS